MFIGDIMVWIKDIWIYFLKSEPTAYIDLINGNIYFEANGDAIKIPKPFSKEMLLKEFIQSFENNVKYNGKQLYRYFNSLNDQELVNVFHHNLYAGNSESVYWQYFPYAKKRIFDYAEEWCIENNLSYSCKEYNAKDKYTYLSI